MSAPVPVARLEPGQVLRYRDWLRRTHERVVTAVLFVERAPADASWPFPRICFIEIHLGKGPEGARNFDEFTTAINNLVAPYNAHLRTPSAYAAYAVCATYRLPAAYGPQEVSAPLTLDARRRWE